MRLCPVFLIWQGLWPAVAAAQTMVYLLETPEDSARARIELIRDAQREICLSTYIF
jgi:phosphatidylserine/phosphatidylglycerophosphate/cardiolipin synthase-like enzyme